jgi:ABC-type Fe3+/spermidine/putrescine transport system ATPase subunit
MNDSPDIAVEVAGLSKAYGSVVAVKSIDLAIESGQYFVLLGPSGGGKTTLLRLIGGFIRPGAGTILLHGRDVTGLPPNRRPTTMVFQGYALFPHMNVEKNVGYGLRLRKLAKDEIRENVRHMLGLVGLEGYEERMPHELSGGQQQRVQLARSLVLDADILLLDEPLAALDAKLRKDMCIELKRIQEQIGITFIHVTHNQEEAMTIADRIAIIAAGELVEEGTARDVYERPMNRFTADFIGENNIFDGAVAAQSEKEVVIDLGYGRISVPPSPVPPADGSTVAVSIRSERLQLLDGNAPLGDGMQALPGTYLKQVYVGLTTSHLVALPDGQEISVRELSQGGDAAVLHAGREVIVAWDQADARLLNL